MLFYRFIMCIICAIGLVGLAGCSTSAKEYTPPKLEIDICQTENSIVGLSVTDGLSDGIVSEETLEGLADKIGEKEDHDEESDEAAVEEEPEVTEEEAEVIPVEEVAEEKPEVISDEEAEVIDDEEAAEEEVEFVTAFDEIIESRTGIAYCVTTARIRTGPHISYDELDVVEYSETVELLGQSSGSWSTAKFGDVEGWIYIPYFQDTEPPKQLDMSSFPLVWEDGANKITINKQKMYNNWCYIAHLEFSDYDRFGSAIAHNSRGSFETTSAAANRLGAVFCVNGPYSWGELANSYAIIRNDTVFHDKDIEDDLGTYSNVTGKMVRAKELGVSGKLASAVAGKSVSDTFKFWNSTLVLNGKNISNPDNTSRAQRTFMGTTGNAGDIFVICSEGRYVDGASAGLTKYECAKVLQDLGCTYGVMLDGGGSTTMYFNGQVLTSSKYNQRAVVDFIYFK